jgi:hypothetical protein
MRIAFGLKSHSGWAALVVIGKLGEEMVVVDRRRIELVEQAWAKQPYHAAEGLEPQKARDLVKRAIDSVHRVALNEMKAAVKRERDRRNEIVGCSVLVGSPMPDWSTDQILAVHFRMHKAEGVLFQNALVRASEKCKLYTLPVLEKELLADASTKLRTRPDLLVKQIAGLGKSAGAPWGKDQKDAALAAFVLLNNS